MNTINIVTSICIDQDKSDESIYDSMRYTDSTQRRYTYWKCASVLFASSIRCNPHAKHILYTNDKLPLTINRVDIKAFLIKIGVEIRYMDFTIFKPPVGYSDMFKNAFYKLDVIKALGEEGENYNVMLDSDCVWVNHSNAFFDLVKSDSLLLYDVFERIDPHKKISSLSRVMIGNLFKEIDSAYPVSDPIQFGGEFVAGSSRNFKIAAEQMEATFKYVLNKFDPSSLPRFYQFEGFFDGDEYLSSFVYNKMPVKCIDAKDYVRRIWTWLDGKSRATPADLNLTIWHVPAEKKQGFIPLFNEIITKKSLFWRIPLHEFNVYLGERLGVPKRSYTKDKWFKLRKGLQVAKYIYHEEIRSIHNLNYQNQYILFIKSQFLKLLQKINIRTWKQLLIIKN